MNSPLRISAAVGAIALMALAAPGRPPESVIDPKILLKRVIRANTSDVLPKEDGIVSVFSADTRKRLSLLMSNYVPLVEGSESICGRPAWVLRLKPRLKRRPWRQLWVDKRDFSVLAMREWSHRNTIRRSLIIGRCPDPDADPVKTKPQRNVAPEVLIVPSYVPAGFSLSDVRLLVGKGITQVVYSDGMFSVSVFCRPESVPPAGPAAIGLYACGHATAVAVCSRRMRVDIIGDLPDEELLRMARSLKQNTWVGVQQHL